jgi:hypothetical protein
MPCRQIELDDESDRILSALAQDYEGDLGKALGGLLRDRESIESFVAACEEDQRDALLVQRERAERGFREGRFTAWDEVKRHNNL